MKSRYSILIVLCTAYLLSYLDRMAMASAIPFIAEEFHLSSLAMGAVLSAFFFGYSAMQIPGGLLADKLGPNRVMTTAILCWSVCTVLTGAAGSFAGMLVIRVLFGLSEGPFPPSASKAIARWFPQREVGRANGIMLSSILIGAALAPLFVTTLSIRWGWRSVFYSLLAPGLIVAFLVWVLVKDSPPEDQRTAGHERLELDGAGSKVSARPLGLMQLLKMPAVLWCAVALFFGNMAAWGLTNWLPTYLLQARGFSVQKMGLFASAPPLAGAAGYFLGGYVSDKYFRHRRQFPIVLGLVLSSAATYLAATAPTGEWAVADLVLASLFTHVASAGLFTLPLVLVQHEAVGRAFGIVNTAGQVAGFLSPLFVGYILDMSHKDFTLVFYVFVALFLAAAFLASRIKSHRPALG